MHDESTPPHSTPPLANGPAPAALPTPRIYTGLILYPRLD